MVSSEIVANFTSEQQEAGKSASTINGYLRTLRRAFILAESWKLIRPTQRPNVSLLKGEKNREYVISEKTLEKLITHEKISDTLKLMLPFLVDTGLRITECLELTWSRVYLTPKPGTTLGSVFIAKGKTKNARRYIPLTERARQILLALKGESRQRGFVWLTEDGTHPLSRNWVSEQFRTVRDALSLSKDCVIHSTRHTYCTNLGANGADAFAIQNLAGHGSITLSARYVHPDIEMLESAVLKLQKKPVPIKAE